MRRIVRDHERQIELFHVYIGGGVVAVVLPRMVSLHTFDQAKSEGQTLEAGDRDC